MLQINQLSPAALEAELFKCCGSTRWANELSKQAPFENKEDLFQKSNAIWLTSSKEDGKEAFSYHPKIGNLKNLEAKFNSTKEWAGNEQAGVNHASQEILMALAQGNEDYEAKFGYIFIVCATGKSAEEMLKLLNDRITNGPETEFAIAMNEQNKITRIRLEKLIA